MFGSDQKWQSRFLQDQRGFGLFITLLVSLVILIVLGTALWMTNWGTKERQTHYHYEKMYQVASGQMNAIARFYDLPENEFALQPSGYFDASYNVSNTFAGISSTVSALYPEYAVRNPNWMEADGTFRGDLIITKTTPPVQTLTFKYKVRRYRGNGGTLNLLNLTNNLSLNFSGISFNDTLTSLVAAEDPLADFLNPFLPLGDIAGEIGQNPEAAIITATRSDNAGWVPSAGAVTPSKTIIANPDPTTWEDVSTGEEILAPADIEKSDAIASVADATFSDIKTYSGQPMMRNYEGMVADEKTRQNRLANFSDAHIDRLVALLMDKAINCPFAQSNVAFFSADMGTLDFFVPLLASTPTTYVFLPGGRLTLRMLPSGGVDTGLIGTFNFIMLGTTANPSRFRLETPAFANYGTITALGQTEFEIVETATTMPGFDLVVKNHGSVTAVAGNNANYNGQPTLNVDGTFASAVAVGNYPRDLYTLYNHLTPCATGGTYSDTTRRGGRNHPLQAKVDIFSVIQR